MGKRNPSSKSTGRTSLRLKLYVAGAGPNSTRARANLEKLIQEFLKDDCELAIEDVLENPSGALNEGLVVTPVLVRLAPTPKIRIVGDLSDTEAVLSALRLKGEGYERS